MIQYQEFEEMNKADAEEYLRVFLEEVKHTEKRYSSDTGRCTGMRNRYNELVKSFETKWVSA